MNNVYKKHKFNLKGFQFLLMIVLLINFSCKKIDSVQSTRLASEKTNWKTLEDARANLLSFYALLRTAIVADNAHWVMGDLRKGDFTITNKSDLKAVTSDQLNAQHPLINRITNWRAFYAAINAASLFIERSKEILSLDRRYSELNNKMDIAQARAARAFAYFYMTRIWGDVPLITSSHDGQFIKVARTSKERVLSYAASELFEVAQVLPFRFGGDDPIFPGVYYNGDTDNWAGVLFTRLSVYTILAHIAAWQGNYIDVANYSKFVLDNRTKGNPDESNFSLVYINMNGLTENDGETSPFAFKRPTLLVGFPSEAGDGLSTANGHIEQLTLASPFVPKSTPEMYVSRDSILKIFTNSKDLRFSIDEKTNLYRTNYFYDFPSNIPIFNKIKVLFPPDSKKSNQTFFSSALVFSRLEEVTLLRAEAMAVLGDENEAINALNTTMDLRGIKYTVTPGVSVIDAIFAERRRELMGEGWRWYDIIRYNRIKNPSGTFITKNGVNMTFKQFQDAGGIYWPVSQDIINANPQITQNPYWTR